MDFDLETAVIELERLTAEFKATNYKTDEDRKQALIQLKNSDCFKVVEQFVGPDMPFGS